MLRPKTRPAANPIAANKTTAAGHFYQEIKNF
jgi:hypothetical protein